MADPWCPYASRDPGSAAGYAHGRSNMTAAVCHYTVGKNSAPIGRQGYFHFLIGRDGKLTQFCEVDAVAWHAGDPWNGRGPGIEVEYLDEPEIFTDEARDAAQAVCSWITHDWGIPADFYDGARINAWDGFITHRSLIQTGDQHSDFWPADDAAIIFGGDMPLDLKDLAGIKKAVGGDANLDGSIPTISQVVADIAELREMIKKIGGAAVTQEQTVTGTFTGTVK